MEERKESCGMPVFGVFTQPLLNILGSAHLCWTSNELESGVAGVASYVHTLDPVGPLLQIPGLLGV